MKELVEVLRKRGYWVTEENDELILDTSYIIIEFYTLLEILHFVEIPFEKGTKGIRIFKESITKEKLDKIYTLPKGVQLPILPKEKEFEPIGYLNGTYNLNVLELEPEIAPLVYALNRVGFFTISSKITTNQLMIYSTYKEHVETINLVLEKAKELVNLNYSWKTILEDRGYAIEVQFSEKTLAHEDSYTLANFFIQCFPSISEEDLEQWN